MIWNFFKTKSAQDDTTTSTREFDLEELLKQYATPSNIPKTTRVDSQVARKMRQPLSLFDMWKYIQFVTIQATYITCAFLRHHLFGPVKPSWPIEMTLLTTFLRHSTEFTDLSSIQLLRRFLNLGQILPAPKDGIVTPVTFSVKRRGLTGFLAAADALEDGTRELTGEWVINRKLWRRMQEQRWRSAAADPDASQSDNVSKEQVILYLHGGAYYVMSAASHRYLTVSISKYTECRLFAVNYRLAPETQFPGALMDSVAAYFRLIYDLKIPNDNIVFMGDSAGGGLCMSLLLYLRDEGYPLPSGAVLMSPWVDLTMSCSSWDTNAKFDYLPQPADNDHLHPVKCFFRPEEIREYITHPYASPLFGDLTGLPPLLIQCGDAERLRDEDTLLAHKAILAGVQVEHEIYQDCVHVFQMFEFLEQTTMALRSIRQFFKSLPSRKPMDKSQMDGQIMAAAHAMKSSSTELDSQRLPSSIGTPNSADDEFNASMNDSIEMDSVTTSRLLATPKTSTRAQDDALLLAVETSPVAPSPPPRPRHTASASAVPTLSKANRVLRRYSFAFPQSPLHSAVLLDSADIHHHSPASTPPVSPPSSPSRRHARSISGNLSPLSPVIQTTRDVSLRVRPRANSHPNILALMEDYARGNVQDEYESTLDDPALASSATTSALDAVSTGQSGSDLDAAGLKQRAYKMGQGRLASVMDDEDV